MVAVSVQRERRRLNRAFRAALVAVASPAAFIACSSSGSTATEDDTGLHGAADATVDSLRPEADAREEDAASVREATVADGARPPLFPPADAGPDRWGGCFAGAYEVNAGLDATPQTDTCAYVYACGLDGTGLGVSGCQVLQVVANGELAPLPMMTCWLPQDAGCNDDALAPENEAGGVTVYCTPCPPGGGRRPTGLRRHPPPRARTALGAYLASMAFEEEASIVAFERMREELESLGAPAPLIAAAERAARDEREHAETMTRLALARGAGVVRARVPRVRKRSLAAVATENAREGCIRETYGALLAKWQSVHAEDAELRRAFARIADHEASHAALSWALARWIEERLAPATRKRVARARALAIRELRSALGIEPAPDVARLAGLPPAKEARALFVALTGELGLGCYGSTG